VKEWHTKKSSEEGGQKNLEGFRETIKYLISRGADLTVRDKKGNTPLDMAASKGDLERVKFLISQGARVDRRAIELARKEGHHKIAQYLESLLRSSKY